MALQAAGVPVTAPVAGVAMGLIKEGDDYIVLTDIAGVEDHLGDMDFKVAGTKDGITALQMDIKITGVTFEILEDALEQALKGRQFILGKMAEAIDGPREKLSKHAPAIESIKIDPEKIGAVIGKGGETIRALCEEFEAEIDVEDDGTVRIYAPTGELVEACVARIDSMTKEAEVGDRYNAAKVVKTTTFGAFVELVKGTDGLLHISNVKPGERVDSVDDVLNAGEEIDVTVVEVDKERGRIGLRLSDDPSVAGKSPEELASVGSGDGGRGATAATAAARGGRDRDAAAAARARARAASVERDAQLTELGSGVRVVTEEVPSVRSVALGLWVRTGSRNETPAQAGVSHFLEHLLFKGTERYSAIEISERFDGLGASVNAATGKETTHLHARFLDEHTEEVFDLLAEMLLAPTYPEIDSERQVVLEEIAMYEDEPQDRVHDVLAEAVFGEHPLGRRVLGEAEVIASIPVPDIEAYRSAHYTAPQIVVGAAGHLDHDRIVELAEAAGQPADGERGAAPRRPRSTSDSRLCFRSKETEQYHICFGAPGHAPRRRAALPAGRARLDLRRLDLLAALPRGAREARPRLLGRLLQRAVHRPGPGRHLRRHPRGQRRGGLLDHRHRAGAPALRAGLGRGAGAGEGERQGPARPLLGVDRGADDADLPRDPVRPADRKPRRDAGQSRRDRGRRADRAGRRALRRRPPLGRLRRGRRGSLPRGAGAGQRGPGSGMTRVAVAGAAGKMGATVCEAVEEAEAGADRPRRPGAGIELAEVLPDADVVVDFTAPDTALANVRACLEAGVHTVVGTTGFDLEPPARPPRLRRPTASSPPTSRSARCC